MLISHDSHKSVSGFCIFSGGLQAPPSVREQIILFICLQSTGESLATVICSLPIPRESESAILLCKYSNSVSYPKGAAREDGRVVCAFGERGEAK